ncbi:MAG: TatD family hydrolase, partial [Pseudomonadota bacterium]|nr:TatD family hydrolase [Pseudomonadota bacterium]
MMKLFDTHTHFDVADFDHDRQQLAVQAKRVGVESLVLIGFLASRFDDLIQTHQQLQAWNAVPQSYLAPGLHPFYIEQHQAEHLQRLEQVLQRYDCVAVGEIGLDTFLKQHKQSDIFVKQQDYFNAQLELATQYQKPVLLHIRKAHAETIA